TVFLFILNIYHSNCLLLVVDKRQNIENQESCCEGYQQNNTESSVVVFLGPLVKGKSERKSIEFCEAVVVITWLAT
ncbi:MAG: hypothetical protein MHPSP_004238, partial [Paramarteilia canceri]